jgi:hypothetical protein
MRVFRQPTPGNWDGLIERVLVALAQEVERKASGAQAAPSLAQYASAAAAKRQVPREDRHNVRSGLCRVTESRHGIVMYYPDGSRCSHAIGLYGEANELRVEALLRHVDAGMTTIHVAAGCGIDTMPLARALGHTGQLFVYENDPLLRQILSENLKANRIENVTLMRSPLGDPIGSFANIDKIADSGAQAPENVTSRFDTIDALRLERLHWLCTGETTDIPTLLRGGAATLWRLRPRLFIEIAEDGSVESVVSAVTDFGYACWLARFPWFNAQNFNRHGEDLFAGAMARVVVALPEEGEMQLPRIACEKLS